MILRAFFLILVLLAGAVRAEGRLGDPLTPEALRDAAAADLAARGAAVEIVDGVTLRARLPGGAEVVAALDNLMRAVASAAPDAREAVLERWIGTIVASEGASLPATGSALEALRPTIYPAAYLDHVRATGLAAAGARPVAGVLWAALVLDSPSSAALFTEADGAALGIDAAAAEARAFANLRALLPNLRIAREGTIGWLELDGYYENALILLPEVWEEVDALLEGRPVMITPARGQVFFASEHDAAALAEMADYAFAAQASEPGPISAEMYLWTGAGWELFRR